MPSVQQKLEASRKDLLDLGLRNPLINFRARTRSIEVVDEKTAEVYRILAAEGREMSFASLPKAMAERLATAPLEGDAAETAAEEALVDEDTDWSTVFATEGEEEGPESGPAARHTDTRLQTRLTDDVLTLRLINIHSAARTVLEEQGVNVLYLALGFLHWFEADASTEARKAPLLLIPVELRRSNVQQRFKVAWTGGDIGDNLSLREKLKAEFGFDLPAFLADGENGVSEHFESVAEAIAGKPRWSVAMDEIHLGFFSFGKFLMYHDLDLENWPDPAGAYAHPVLASLFDVGFRSDSSPFTEDTHLDEAVAADAVHTVVDADSTQTLALLDAASGRTMRIEGPPGTGKSQTITNLIADAIGKGKKVLFVAEKMAALEVVKRRLDKVQLGDAVLELHSNKANKRALLDEMRRTYDLGKPHLDSTRDDLQQLTRVRDRLNDYCKAVNEPVDATEVRPIDALGRMLGMTGEGVVQQRFDFAEMQSWSGADFRERRVLIEELAKKLRQMGRPVDSPFWGSRIRLLSPVDHGLLRQALIDTASLAEKLWAESRGLATRLHLPEPTTIANVQVVRRAALRALEAPHDVTTVDLRSGDWQARRDDIRTLLDAGETRTKLLAAHAESLIPEAWDQDLLEVRETLVTCSGSWWRRLSGRFRRAKARLRGLSRGDLPSDRAVWLARVDAVLESRRLKTEFDRLELLGAALFRVQWQGMQSDWTVLRALTDWVVGLYRELGDGTLPTGILDFLSGSPQLVAVRPDLEATSMALDACDRALTDLRTRLEAAAGTTDAPGHSDPFGGTEIAALPARLRDLASRLDELGWLADFNRLSAELRGLGLATVIRRAEEWSHPPETIVRAFDWTWYEGIFNTAFTRRTALQQFDRISHEHAITTFRKLDEDLQQRTRAALMLQHWQSLPHASGDGEVGILRREITKKRGWLPIRRLMGEAGRAVQAVKPVFMMSPLSVATFLPPGSVNFDLVVFDEASQIKPVDAVGAILRARQAVVVGDTKQLPPTNFFDVIAGAVTEDEANTTADQESVLGLFAAQGAPCAMLRWHYRSRHESLIALSNQEFYDSRLVVFPAAGFQTEAKGLVFHHLPETEYARGGSRSNKGEARAVAEAVLRHARESPHLTLGVAAFSVAQRDAIEMEIEALRRMDPSCEEFFCEHPTEPFFVKNLENVQGDERDVIFISVGYGKTKDGYLAMAFGPLNRDGGERRLNVLITRARLACEVFSNFTADDLDLGRSGARGVASLKKFLAYARDRTLAIPMSTGRPTDSPFEDAVIRSLASAGLDPEPQVGCAGFFIDIGIRDPEAPGRYALGVECDGAAYHSARSARDRDRLREAVLRGLGWEIHRIWSSDWFRNPDRELKRVLEAVEAAKLAHKRRAARSATSTRPAHSEETAVTRTAVTKVTEAAMGSAADPYRKATPSIRLGGRQLHELPAKEMSACVEQVVNTEGPVAAVEVARRITEAAGLQRTGSRIQAAVEAGIEDSVRRGTLRRRGDFLWPQGMSTVAVRDRSDVDAQARKLELVCDEEIAAALLDVVARAFSISREDAVATALRLLGFQRISADMRVRCGSALAGEVRAGRILEDGGKLRLPT